MTQSEKEEFRIAFHFYSVILIRH